MYGKDAQVHTPKDVPMPMQILTDEELLACVGGECSWGGSGGECREDYPGTEG